MSIYTACDAFLEYGMFGNKDYQIHGIIEIGFAGSLFGIML